MRPLVIYHFPCTDGFTAASVAHLYFKGEADFHPANHGDAPPDVTDRTVYLLDFCYPYEQMVQIVEKANDVTVLDHHKTAVPILNKVLETHPKIRIVTLMEKAGCRLAWEYWFPNRSAPSIIDYVEDRDLWNNDVVDSGEVNEALRSYPYDFEFYTSLLLSDVLADNLKREGEILMRKRHKDVTEFIEHASHRMNILGHNVPALNCPYMWTSDAGHIMCHGEPFAVCYYVNKEAKNVVLGFRSTDEGLDVEEIAKKLGGGGHRNASGCRVPLATWNRMFPIYHE